MINDLESYINQASKKELKFLMCLYETFKKLDVDPISMEIQIDLISKTCQQKNLDFSEKYLLDLIKIIKMIDYDSQIKIIRIHPENYSQIMSVLTIKKNFIEQKIIDYESKLKFVDQQNTNIKKYTQEDLIKILKNMYDNAPEGYQMTMVHLFGLKYVDQLKDKKIKDIAIAATGKDSLHVEIGKGIKLSKYVELIITKNDSDMSIK